MKACIALSIISLVVGIEIAAGEPHRFPPRFLFPGELNKVRNTFSIEGVRRAQEQRRQEETPIAPPLRPVPIPPPEMDLEFEGTVEEFEPNPVELLGIEPFEEHEDDGGDAPLFEEVAPPPVREQRPRRPLTDEEWRLTA